MNLILVKAKHEAPLFFDRGVILRKSKVKGHYRHLPNGKIVWIQDYFNKRKAAANQPKKFRHQVVHADAKSTTYMNGEGEMKTYAHQPYNEMSQEEIHGHLNSAMPVDKNMAWNVVKNKFIGMEGSNTSLDDWIKTAIDEQKKKDKPEFTNKEEAMNWLEKHLVNPIHKQLQKHYGQVTTYAQAYHEESMIPDVKSVKSGKPTVSGTPIKDYFNSVKMDSDQHNEHEKAVAKMVREHATSALEAQAREKAEVERAQQMKPTDMPRVPGIDKDIKFFGHQAESIAKLNVLEKAILDVDMGGGKGLILPTDALNLMNQGKVKKPLIIVPAATLDQNASVFLNQYVKGRVNVFKITNQTIGEHYGGDVGKMIEDVQKAPPNTIFMASYDVFTYAKRDKTGKPVGDEDPDKYERAQSLSAAKFDLVSLDESHNIKNTQSVRFQSMKYLSKAKYKRVASGTFLSNNPVDVLGQWKWLNPVVKYSDAEFKEKFGREETKEGVRWDQSKLKDLRKELLGNGMISLRRSAWIHKLPERNEELAVTKMDDRTSKVFEAALDDVLTQLEEDAAKDPRLKKLFDLDDELDPDEELPPAVIGKLDLLGGITDYPDIMADLVTGAYKTVRQAKKEGLDEEEDPHYAEALHYLKRFSPATRKAIAALGGKVSPKAQDVYEKLKTHFKDKKNGKYIVFCQRKFSAEHIMKHMPEEFKKDAMYFDASKMDKLPSFAKDPNGPKIIVAVDASIKDGMNLQIANGMYRYDHHYSPGNQEQSYARIWRFGQDKPVKIHLGVVDGGIDVTKYARMLTKLHQNMQVVSEMPEDTTFPAYKLSLDNIRYHRNAEELPTYVDMNKKILDFQRQENKELRKRYGDTPVDRATGGTIGGNKSEIKHGVGAYHTEFTGQEKGGTLDEDELNNLSGHFREAIKKHHGAGHTYNSDKWELDFPEAVELAGRHKLKGGGKKLDESTVKSYQQELEHTIGEKIPKKDMDALIETVNNWASGKKSDHKPDYEGAVKTMLNHLGLPEEKKSTAEAVDDLKKLMAHVKKNKIEISHVGRGKIEVPSEKHRKALDKYWDAWEKKYGVPSSKYYKILHGAAGMLQEHEHGWESLKKKYGPSLKGQTYEQRYPIESGDEDEDSSS